MWIVNYLDSKKKKVGSTKVRMVDWEGVCTCFCAQVLLLTVQGVKFNNDNELENKTKHSVTEKKKC